MRHSLACRHIARGAIPKWLQQQMGHSSSIKLGLYGAWFRLADERVATNLGSALLGRGNATGEPRAGALGNSVGNSGMG
jgi:hypothetical protein